MTSSVSLFDRVLSKNRSIGVRVLISLLLLLMPFVAAWLDGILGIIFQENSWRVLLVPPSIVIYIWSVAPRMARLGDEVVNTLRPLIEVDAEQIELTVQRSSYVPVRHEIIAIGIGIILGLLSASGSDFNNEAPWLQGYWFLASISMYGLLAWTVFGAITGTRLNAALQRLPLRIDIFDTRAFEVIGRQSLLIALVFIGGITLSFVLTIQPESIASYYFWIFYILMILITITIFFLNMHPTHQLMASEKKRELEKVQQIINNASHMLINQLEQDQQSDSLAIQINALAVYEARVQQTRTWPYNTAMLRTLTFSVFIPLASLGGKLLVDVVSK
jgi:hypothetical protein